MTEMGQETGATQPQVAKCLELRMGQKPVLGKWQWELTLFPLLSSWAGEA